MKREVEATTHVTAERGSSMKPEKQHEATPDLLTGTDLLGYGLISGLQRHPGEAPPLDSGPPPLLGPHALAKCSCRPAKPGEAITGNISSVQQTDLH